LLALGREVKEGGGDEVGGVEDLEVALGGVVALGAVDDGLAGGVPDDFLLRGVDSGDGAEAALKRAAAKAVKRALDAESEPVVMPSTEPPK
jgi:hypothetical protein